MTDEELVAELRRRPALLFHVVSTEVKVASPWFEHKDSEHSKRRRGTLRGLVRVGPDDFILTNARRSQKLVEPFRENEKYDPYGEEFNEEHYLKDVQDYEAELLRWKPFSASGPDKFGDDKVAYADSLEEATKIADEQLTKDGWILA